MNKKIKIPILFLLLLLISKEIFSYDSEKVVIFCILFFIIVTYFNFKEMLYITFLNKSLKLKEEFLLLITSKENLELELKKFWSNFILLESQLLKLTKWIRSNISVIVKKINKNRNYIGFHLVKDHLNLLIKDQLKINQNLLNFLVQNAILNLKALFHYKLNSKLISTNNLNYYFNKLTNITTNSNIIYLILNKLQNNKEFCVNNKNWINLNSFLYFKYSTQNIKL